MIVTLLDTEDKPGRNRIRNKWFAAEYIASPTICQLEE
jgi:hypothetical protein